VPAEPPCIFLVPQTSVTRRGRSRTRRAGTKARGTCARAVGLSRKLPLVAPDSPWQRSHRTAPWRHGFEWQRAVPFDLARPRSRVRRGPEGLLCGAKVDPDAPEPPGFPDQAQHGNLWAPAATRSSYSAERGLRVFPTQLKTAASAARRRTKKVARLSRRHLRQRDDVRHLGTMVRAPGRQGEAWCASLGWSPTGPHLDGEWTHLLLSGRGQGKLGDGFYTCWHFCCSEPTRSHRSTTATRPDEVGTSQTRRRLRIRAQALRTKVRDFRDLPQTCRFLCDNFSAITPPNGARCRACGAGQSGSKVVHNLMTFALTGVQGGPAETPGTGVLVEVVSEAHGRRARLRASERRGRGARRALHGAGWRSTTATLAGDIGLQVRLREAVHTPAQVGGGVRRLMA
jgi:hypothetical protein